MATSTYVQQPHNIPYPQNLSNYAHQPYTPPSSITPPSQNVSPTNSNSQFTSKWNNSARQVGYLPAALRPTELPGKIKRPLTPPRSVHSSLDSQSSQLSHATFSTHSLPTTPTDEFGGFLNGPPEGLVSRVVSDEWVDELGEVVGAPARSHWKPDSSAVACSSSSCDTVFSLWSRRHHCRRCGDIYCGSHTAHSVPLDHYARFHPQGSMERACDKCHDDYEIWWSNRKSRASSRTASGATTPVGGAPTPIGQNFLGIPQKSHTHQPLVPGNESVADWHWSTF